MRTTVKILGIGGRIQGVTKSGRNYDFTPVSFAYQVTGFTGHRAETANVQSDMLVNSGMHPGSEVDMVFHFQNYRPVIDAILG